MSTRNIFAESVIVIEDDSHPDPMSIVKDVELPSGLSLLGKVEAVRWEFERVTRRELSYVLAIEMLGMVCGPFVYLRTRAHNRRLARAEF